MTKKCLFNRGLIFLVAVGVLALSACQVREPGPFERAGERADEVSENVAEGKNPLHKKGPLEEAGDAVDDVFDGEDER